MVRHFSLCTVFLVLSLCGTSAAQQALVEVKDERNPCSRFKMRILMPADSIDFKLLVKKVPDGIDYKMVWNPCPRDEPQLAVALPQPAPDQQGNILVQRPFAFQFSTTKTHQKKRSELLLPQPPTVFEVKQPQK